MKLNDDLSLHKVFLHKEMTIKTDTLVMCDPIIKFNSSFRISNKMVKIGQIAYESWVLKNKDNVVICGISQIIDMPE